MKGIWKRLLVCATALVLSFSFVGCGGGTESSTDGSTGASTGGDEKQTVSLLTDGNFEKGFKLRGLDSSTDSGVVKTIDYGTGGTPTWTMAQWWSKYNLKDGEENITENVYSLKDESKTVEVNRKYGSITLGLDGSKEFDTYNIVPPSKWPHLLIEQSISGASLADAEKVEASLDFTLTVNEDKRESDGVGSQAQFAWFIYIVDTNPESEGYGNFLWFGLNIFDSTKLYAPKSTQQDMAGGPGNYIYALGAADYMTERVKTNKNIRFTVDILPHITKALTKAQSEGFMTGTTFDDCSVTGMNIGWEVFDRWNESITIFDIDIVKTVGKTNGGDGASSDSETPETPEATLGDNVLKDGTFKNGFNLLGVNAASDGTTVYKKIKYGSSLGTSRWNLAQWWSKYNLKDGTETALADKYTLADTSKRISVDMQTYGVELAVDASKEFDAYNTSAPSTWPHLLVEQSLSEPVMIGDAQSVTATLDFKVNYAEDLRGGDGQGLHTQFAWFIYIVDKNPESPGYGNFLWFGLNIYCPPSEVAGGYSSQDTAGGFGNYIYSLSADTFITEMPAVGKTTEISFDILPHVQAALTAAQEKGFMPGTTVADVAVTGTNIGWEVFDRWNVSITINEIGLYVKK